MTRERCDAHYAMPRHGLSWASRFLNDARVGRASRTLSRRMSPDDSSTIRASIVRLSMAK